MADTLIVETAGLRKNYGPMEALRGLSLQVPRGSIFGFLGRNGAGKTTTIKILMGMARATIGHARVFGLPADARDASVEIRRRVGFVSEDKDLYDYMSVEETIRFTAAFYPRWRGDLEQRYLRKFELPPDRKVKALSRGMRTKLALLLALCRGAELLVLPRCSFFRHLQYPLSPPLARPGTGKAGSRSPIASWASRWIWHRAPQVSGSGQ